jgi:hypothetical protein
MGLARTRRETYSDLAPKKVRIVTFLLVLICSVIMTCTGKRISATSVSMLRVPMPRQNAGCKYISNPSRFLDSTEVDLPGQSSYSPVRMSAMALRYHTGKRQQARRQFPTLQ